MKIWGSSAPSGQILPISDTNCAAGFYYLGNNPPTAEEFNWLFQQLTQGIVTAGRFWQASTAYEVGHVLYSSDFAQSFKRFECTTAGTSGTTEPTWGIAGTTMTDGTCQWKVVDVKNFAPAFQGAYVYRGSGGNQSISGGATSFKVILNTVSYDTKNFWDSANARILIPAGVSRVILFGSCVWPDAITTSGSGRAIHVYKNGSLLASLTSPATSTTTASQVTTAPIPVIQGDYFELWVTNSDTVAKNVSQDFRTFLAMEVLG